MSATDDFEHVIIAELRLHISRLKGKLSENEETVRGRELLNRVPQRAVVNICDLREECLIRSIRFGFETLHVLRPFLNLLLDVGSVITSYVLRANAGQRARRRRRDLVRLPGNNNPVVRYELVVTLLELNQIL
jgi:hypothetical protein